MVVVVVVVAVIVVVVVTVIVFIFTALATCLHFLPFFHIPFHISTNYLDPWSGESGMLEVNEFVKEFTAFFMEWGCSLLSLHDNPTVSYHQSCDSRSSPHIISLKLV